jgi:uncharacterized protein (TIGR03083 family)
MDDNQVWQTIDEERLRLADVLDQLTEKEWRHPSLCEGWTVCDVVAHLTLQQIGLSAAMGMLIRGPKLRGMNRMIHDAACRRAATLSTDQMIAAIGDMVGSRKHNLGLTCRETLIDILVHGQDIAVPLRRPHPMPVNPAAEAATRVWTTGWPFHARKRFDGFRITATDTPWAVGYGQEVEGPMEAILLLLTGRLVALPRLSGEGAPA